MRIRDEQKETAIRREAMRQIVKHGFDGLSMGKLAKGAGVSPATIYIYFKDRDDLIVQLCNEQSQEMVAATLKGFSPEMDFESGLRQQWKNRLAYWLKHPLEAQFLEQAKHSPYGEQAMKYVRAEFSSQLGEFMCHAVKNKQVKELPVEVYWSIAFAPLYSLIKFHISGKGMGHNKNFVLTDDILEQALQLVLATLKP